MRRSGYGRPSNGRPTRGGPSYGRSVFDYDDTDTELLWHPNFIEGMQTGNHYSFGDDPAMSSIMYVQAMANSNRIAHERRQRLAAPGRGPGGTQLVVDDPNTEMVQALSDEGPGIRWAPGWDGRDY